jgi:arylsulfatase A-like enzyme
VRDKPWYIQQIAPWDSQKQAKWDKVREDMLESLIDVDRWVGNIVNALQETGRLDNTMIVFTSDNGYLLGEHRWSGKVVPYDESIRVPWIVRWDAADLPEAGGTDDHLMLNTDFAPTFADVAGTSMGSTDGSDFAQLAAQPWDDGDWRTYFLIEHGGQTSGNDATGITYCGVRTENYMYAQYWNGFEELYDINGDSNQLQNVAPFGQFESVLNIERDRTHQLCNPEPPGYHFSH